MTDTVDTFTRADSTTSPGPLWTAYRGTFGISSNKAYPVSLVGADDVAGTDVGVADGTVRALFNPASNGSWVGIAYRIVDINNYRFFVQYTSSGGGFSLYSGKCEAGTYTYDHFANLAITYLGAPFAMSVRMSGTTIQTFYNDAQVSSDFTSSLGSSSHVHGFDASGTGSARIDDWTFYGGAVPDQPVGSVSLEPLTVRMLRDSPRVLYAMDSAGQQIDRSGWGRTASPTGTFDATRVEPVGRAMARVPYRSGGYFTEDTQHINDNAGTGDFAMELWLRFVGSMVNYIPLVTRDVSTANNGVTIFINPAGTMRSYVNQATLSGTVNVADGRPHHIVFTRRNGVCSNIVDGAVDGTSSSMTGNVNVGPFGLCRVGDQTGGYQAFTGFLSHFAWYTKALDAAACLERWNIGSGLVIPPSRRRHR